MLVSTSVFPWARILSIISNYIDSRWLELCRRSCLPERGCFSPMSLGLLANIISTQGMAVSPRAHCKNGAQVFSHMQDLPGAFYCQWRHHELLHQWHWRYASDDWYESLHDSSLHSGHHFQSSLSCSTTVLWWALVILFGASLMALATKILVASQQNLRPRRLLQTLRVTSRRSWMARRSGKMFSHSQKPSCSVWQNQWRAHGCFRMQACMLMQHAQFWTT